MKRLFAAMLVGTAVLATPAAAQDDHGKVQVKLLGTAVLPDGKITAVNVDTVGLPAGTQTEANDNVVPPWRSSISSATVFRSKRSAA